LNWTIYKWEARVVALWLMALVVALCVARNAAAVTVHLEAKDTSSTVLLHVGDRLRVDLPSSPASGFRWKAKALDASHLELLSRNVHPDSGRLDAPGVQVFVWRALSPGQADIGIAYSRPSDDKTIPPAKRVTILVEVVAGELAPAASAAQDATASDLTRNATYRGVLSCDGCTGIAVELTLFAAQAADSPGGMLFVERRRYQGAPGGDRTVAGTGRLVVVKGTYADPSMTVYALAAPDGSLENLKVSGDELVPLDAQMLPVPQLAGSSTGPGSLKKVPDTTESGASAP
jgi:inhibitor of cysteine peptidase